MLRTPVFALGSARRAHAQSAPLPTLAPGITMKALALLVASICMACCGPVHAQYLNMLATTPISKFNAADNKLFMATIDKALKQDADGVPMSWANEKTSASGVVTVQRTFTSNGMVCRELLVATAYKTLKNQSTHTLCKNAAGHWKLAQ